MLNRILSSKKIKKEGRSYSVIGFGEKYKFCKYCNFEVQEKIFQNHLEICKKRIETCLLCHHEFKMKNFYDHWETCLTKLFKKGLFYIKMYGTPFLKDCDRLYNYHTEDRRIEYNSLNKTQIKILKGISNTRSIYEIIDVCNCGITVPYIHHKVISTIENESKRERV